MHANNAHSSIRFINEISQTNICFFDTGTTEQNGVMSAVIFDKPFDKHQYLSAVISDTAAKIIPDTQTVWVKQKRKRETRLSELWYHLQKRGYNNENITRGFRNADLVSRE